MIVSRIPIKKNLSPLKFISDPVYTSEMEDGDIYLLDHINLKGHFEEFDSELDYFEAVKLLTLLESRGYEYVIFDVLDSSVTISYDNDINEVLRSACKDSGIMPIYVVNVKLLSYTHHNQDDMDDTLEFLNKESSRGYKFIYINHGKL